MNTYVSLIRFTEQGARGLKKSPARAQAFKNAAKKAGVTVEALYWTAGSYDGLLVLKGGQGSAGASMSGATGQRWQCPHRNHASIRCGAVRGDGWEISSACGLNPGFGEHRQ